MSKQNKLTADTTDREIVSTRIFPMPRGPIFDAFRDPEQLKRWWGPDGFTNTFQKFDLRPGGVWQFIMHGPDGTDYHNESEFVEVVEPVRIIFEHRKPIHRFRMTITLDEQEGSTKLRWAMLFDSVEECEKVKSLIQAANEQNFDRLEQHLATSVPKKS